ncbi:MAG: WGxxGxxG-CTERM domain-containing protein [Parachlamydiaceae bacterium]|nr:WGxxGxxG-CTERM domain-containing protein [Parachlamydiaceae bacterium]
MVMTLSAVSLNAQPSQNPNARPSTTTVERENNTVRTERDNNTDWGWIGLLGLFGLAGLLPKKRIDHDHDRNDNTTNRPSNR